MNADIRPIRVLVADDEPHVRLVVAAIVKSLGGEVIAQAGDGEQAVELYRQLRPDVAILDINMPKLRGDEALARITALDPQAVVIMMTAQDAIDSVTDCLDHGARHYILKSNRAEEILGLLTQCWPDVRAGALAREAA
jgi:two-component system, chemotaxis family, chemotaxis protein CheY